MLTEIVGPSNRLSSKRRLTEMRLDKKRPYPASKGAGGAFGTRQTNYFGSSSLGFFLSSGFLLSLAGGAGLAGVAGLTA